MNGLSQKILLIIFLFLWKEITAQCPAFCSSCNAIDFSVCLKCNEGYFLNSGACYQCPEGYIDCTSLTKCFPRIHGYFYSSIYAINVIINVKHVLRLISVHHAEINISWIDKNVTNVV